MPQSPSKISLSPAFPGACVALSEAPENQSAPKRQLGAEERAQLVKFLRETANTPLKLRILQLFLHNPGLCLSSCYVAERLDESIPAVRHAAEQLGEAGALHYCSSFAYTDLCSLNLSRVAPAVRANLELLHFAILDLNLD